MEEKKTYKYFPRIDFTSTIIILRFVPYSDRNETLVLLNSSFRALIFSGIMWNCITIANKYNSSLLQISSSKAYQFLSKLQKKEFVSEIIIKAIPTQFKNIWQFLSFLASQFLQLTSLRLQIALQDEYLKPNSMRQFPNVKSLTLPTIPRARKQEFCELLPKIFPKVRSVEDRCFSDFLPFFYALNLNSLTLGGFSVSINNVLKECGFYQNLIALKLRGMIYDFRANVQDHELEIPESEYLQILSIHRNELCFLKPINVHFPLSSLVEVAFNNFTQNLASFGELLKSNQSLKSAIIQNEIGAVDQSFFTLNSHTSLQVLMIKGFCGVFQIQSCFNLRYCTIIFEENELHISLLAPAPLTLDLTLHLSFKVRNGVLQSDLGKLNYNTHSLQKVEIDESTLSRFDPLFNDTKNLRVAKIIKFTQAQMKPLIQLLSLELFMASPWIEQLQSNLFPILQNLKLEFGKVRAVYVKDNKFNISHSNLKTLQIYQLANLSHLEVNCKKLQKLKIINFFDRSLQIRKKLAHLFLQNISRDAAIICNQPIEQLHLMRSECVILCSKIKRLVMDSSRIYLNHKLELDRIGNEVKISNFSDRIAKKEFKDEFERWDSILVRKMNSKKRYSQEKKEVRMRTICMIF